VFDSVWRDVRRSAGIESNRPGDEFQRRKGNAWRDHDDMPTTAQAAIGRAIVVRIMGGVCGKRTSWRRGRSTSKNFRCSEK
jgi:hypothetical protein